MGEAFPRDLLAKMSFAAFLELLQAGSECRRRRGGHFFQG